MLLVSCQRAARDARTIHCDYPQKEVMQSMDLCPAPLPKAGQVVSWSLGAVCHLVNAEDASASWLACVGVVFLSVTFHAVVGETPMTGLPPPLCLLH